MATPTYRRNVGDGLKAVFTNLFRNADLHGDGLTGVTVVDRGDVVDVQVEDRGPGVPAADRARIFERFARAGGHKVGTGSGLGLSIVELIVRGHRGTVTVRSAPGAGSTFTLRLPGVDPDPRRGAPQGSAA